MTDQKPDKPLGRKAYGTIPHLPGSRQGRDDKGLSVQQASILLEKARDRHDLIIVTEKLDGSNVAVAKLDGKIVPLIRAGHRASDSRWEQHRRFHEWACHNAERFNLLLKEGERCVGELLMQAHGTRYALSHMPFVVFDIITGDLRTNAEHVFRRCQAVELPTPRMIHMGGPISIESVLAKLDMPGGHGALDPIEGAVWRVERKGVFDFAGKYVRPDKVDGIYLPEVTGKEPVWNWNQS